MSVFGSKLLWLVVGGVAAMAVAIYLLASAEQKLHSDTCSGLTTIASDSRKMEYLKAWIASRTSDAEFMDELRRNRSFEAGDGRMERYIDLDWKYLGLNPQMASLTFNAKTAGNPAFEAAKLGSMSIRQARSMIIIRLNNSKDFGLLWPAEELSRIEPIADEVFVYCGT